MLNLELLKDKYRTVIYCPEEWMAKVLIEELEKQFGDAVYKNAVGWWSFYGSETCYWPKIKDKLISMEYCRKDWFIEKGFRVIDFYDAVPNLNDFGEIEIGGCNINSLLEIGV